MDTLETRDLPEDRQGQLRLSIHYQHGQFEVHIIEARHLPSEWDDSCSYQVEVSLMPGDKLSLYKTRTVPASDQPVFDQRLTVDAMDVNQQKRLKVTMNRTKDGKENCGELLGCMSFRVKQLLSRKRAVDGWYYFLPDKAGNKKNLKADVRDVKPTTPAKSRENESVAAAADLTRSSNGSLCRSSGTIPEVNKTLAGLDSFTVVVKRGRLGYGFTVLGSAPVTIGKVDQGTHAECAGLLPGDCIVRINGQNVSRSTADSVARIVKNSPKQIVLDIVRRALPRSASSSIRSSKRHLSSSSSSSLTYKSALSGCYESFPSPAASRRTPTGSSSDRSLPPPPPPPPSSATSRMTASTLGTPSSRGVNDTLPLRPSQAHNLRKSRSSRDLKERHDSAFLCSEDSSIASSTKDASAWDYDYLKWDATNEEIFFPNNEEIYDELPWKPFDCDLLNTAQDEETYATMLDIVDDAEESTLDTTYFRYLQETELTIDEEEVTNSSLQTIADCAHTTLPDVSVSFSSLSRRERARQAAVQHLLAVETAYIRRMQRGVRRFSRPLRHCVLSATEHRTLFQNVEKLLAFSEFHFRQMTSSSSVYDDLPSGAEQANQFVDQVGTVFRPRVALLAEAYRNYCEGLPGALRLLDDLKTYEQFYSFLSGDADDSDATADKENCDDEPTIDDFLSQPRDHLEALMTSLRTVLSYTPPKHSDAADLRHVVEVITSCHDKMSNNNNDSYNRSPSSDNTRSSLNSSGASTDADRSQSSAASGSSGASVSSELQELERRLTFPEGVNHFRLAAPSRHVIYSGELLRVESCVWTKVKAVLTNDLLLLARPAPAATGGNGEERLIVVEEPFPLPDVMSAEFANKHPCEFTLTAEVGAGTEAGWEARHLLLRAPSLEQHCVWKSLLEQRLSSFRSHRELMTGRSREAVH